MARNEAPRLNWVGSSSSVGQDMFYDKLQLRLFRQWIKTSMSSFGDALPVLLSGKHPVSNQCSYNIDYFYVYIEGPFILT